MSKQALTRIMILVSIIVLACGTGAPLTPTPTPTPLNVPKVTISIKGTEVTEITTENISQPNCTGTAEVENVVERSRAIEHVMEGSVGVEFNANGQVGFAGTDIEVGATVAAQLGRSYGSTETITKSMTVKARPGSDMVHTIRQIEVWSIGDAHLIVGDQETTIPFRFRNDFSIELVSSQDMGCNGEPESSTPPPMGILLYDDFNDGGIGTWWNSNCPAQEVNGLLKMALPVNQSAEWEDCEFWSDIGVNSVRKVSLKVTYNQGTNEGWAGILSSCGANALNFMMNSEWVGFSGNSVSRTSMENFNGVPAPITRTLTMEWTGENMVFTVVESRKTASIPCTEPPTSLEIGVGTNPGAFVQSSFDEVVIYGISSSTTPTYPNGYIRFDELTGGIVDSAEPGNFQVNASPDSFCFNSNPANPGAGYFLVRKPQNVIAKNFDGVYAQFDIDTLEGIWSSLGLITRWGDDATGVKIGVYYVGPGPAANGVDGEISVVTTTLGTGGTETTEVFPIHPDLIAPFSVRVERNGDTVNLYYNETTTPFAMRSLPSADTYGTYAHMEGNVSANTTVSACWHDISVLFR